MYYSKALLFLVWVLQDGLERFGQNLACNPAKMLKYLIFVNYRNQFLLHWKPSIDEGKGNKVWKTLCAGSELWISKVQLN